MARRLLVGLVPFGLRAAPPPPVTWQLTWEEAFEGDSLNASRWTAKANESHCCPRELELYVPGAAAVADGVLAVTTRHEPLVGPDGLYNYSSGWIDTKGKFSQRHGRWEANASLPSRVRGAWPAFWLMPDDDSCSAARTIEIRRVEAARLRRQTIQVVAAAPTRRVATEYPRRSRGVAVTRRNCQIASAASTEWSTS